MVISEDGQFRGADATIDQGHVAAWRRYHDNSDVESFSPSFNGGYSGLLERAVSLNPDLINSGEPRTFLLAGFHPNNGTPNEFLSIAIKLHSHVDDVHIFMDRSEASLRGAPNVRSVRRVLSTLEQMDFEPGSLDLVFVDFTTDFMSDEQVRAFADRASKQLSPQGVIFLGKKYAEAWRIMLGRNSDFPEVHPRSTHQMKGLMDELKPIDVIVSDLSLATYMAFARKDSEYPHVSEGVGL